MIRENWYHSIVEIIHAQKRCTVSEKELISIIITLKQFRTILIGQKWRIYTDHKNLTCKNFNTDRIIRWIIQVKGYGTDIECIKGDKK